jgi:Domain of unknown function (DUF4406)
MKIIYIAGPYRASTPQGIKANIAVAKITAIRCWEAGFFVICPHLNTANFEQYCNAPEEQYLDGYLKILSRCDAVVTLPGWENSLGSIEEIKLAKKLSIPVYQFPDMPSLEDS